MKKVYTFCLVLVVMTLGQSAVAGPFTELPLEVQQMIQRGMEEGIITSDSLQEFLKDPSKGGRVMEFFMPPSITTRQILGRYPDPEDREKLLFRKVKEYYVAVGGSNRGFSLLYDDFSESDMIREIQNPGDGGYYFTVDFTEIRGAAKGLQLATIHEAIIAFQEIGKLENTPFLRGWTPVRNVFDVESKKVYVMGQAPVRPLVERRTNGQFNIQFGDNHPWSFRTLSLDEVYYTLTIEREEMKKVTVPELDLLAGVPTWQTRLWLLRRCLSKYGQDSDKCKFLEDDKSASDWNFRKCVLTHSLEYCAAIFEVDALTNVGILNAFLHPERERICDNDRPTKAQIRTLQRRFEFGLVTVGQLRNFSREADKWDPCKTGGGEEEADKHFYIELSGMFSGKPVDDHRNSESHDPYVDYGNWYVLVRPSLVYYPFRSGDFAWIGFKIAPVLGQVQYTAERITYREVGNGRYKTDVDILNSDERFTYGYSLGVTVGAIYAGVISDAGKEFMSPWAALEIDYYHTRDIKSLALSARHLLFNVGVAYTSFSDDAPSYVKDGVYLYVGFNLLPYNLF